MFPMSLQASSVVELLEYEAKRVGVQILCDCAVTNIDKKGNTFTLDTTQGTKTCEKLVITSGSPAAPHLGGSNSGYAFATKMGHSTHTPSPKSLYNSVQKSHGSKHVQG